MTRTLQPRGPSTTTVEVRNIVRTSEEFALALSYHGLPAAEGLFLWQLSNPYRTSRLTTSMLLWLYCAHFLLEYLHVGPCLGKLMIQFHNGENYHL